MKRYDSLYEHGLKRKEKIEKLKKQYAEKCTFQPKINDISRLIVAVEEKERETDALESNKRGKTVKRESNSGADQCTFNPKLSKKSMMIAQNLENPR